jgi:hypothetical protein
VLFVTLIYNFMNTQEYFSEWYYTTLAEPRAQRDTQDVETGTMSCIAAATTGGTGFRWRYRHSFDEPEATLIAAISDRRPRGRQRGPHTRQELRCRLDTSSGQSLFVLAADYPDAHNVNINITFTFTPTGARIKHAALRQSARHQRSRLNKPFFIECVDRIDPVTLQRRAPNCSPSPSPTRTAWIAGSCAATCELSSDAGRPRNQEARHEASRILLGGKNDTTA